MEALQLKRRHLLKKIEDIFKNLTTIQKHYGPINTLTLIEKKSEEKCCVLTII